MKTIFQDLRKIFFAPDELKFHKDWIWIMLVVDKIEEINVHGIKDSYTCSIHHRGTEIYRYGGDHGVIMFEEACTKLEATYKVCIEFVKWYNTQKQIEHE